MGQGQLGPGLGRELESVSLARERGFSGVRKKLERQAGIPVWVLETMLKSWFNWQLKKPVNLKQEIFCKNEL